MANNLEDWLVDYYGKVKHLCQPQQKKHKHHCAIIPSDTKIVYNKKGSPLYLRCLCCNGKIKITVFSEEIKEKIIKADKQ